MMSNGKIVTTLLCVLALSLGTVNNVRADVFDGVAPILWDTTDNRWEPDFNAPLGSSGLTMDIRRFAEIPGNSQGVIPRVNHLTYAPGVSGYFVVDEGLFDSNSPVSGKIYHVSDDGNTVTTVLNVGAVRNLQHTGNFINSQGGLRSIAFHPDFNKVGSAGYGKIYTSQIEVRPGSTSGLNYLGPSSQAPGSNGDGVVSEWTATFDGSGNFTGIDTSSYRELFRIAFQESQHPLRRIAFDPTAKPTDIDYGQLYILQGDGSNGGTGQTVSNPLGTILRINPLDPDGPGGARYSVPTTNVFYDNTDDSVDGDLDEIFAYGLRNGHTIAFARDSNGTRRIFVGDIGQVSVEEINLITGNGGENFGWRPREGTFTFGSPNQFLELPANDSTNNFTYPVAQYAHIFPDTANAVVGGFAIQNGSELDGYYFFYDFSHTIWNGNPAYPKPMMAIALDDAFSATLTGNPDQLTPVDPLTVALVFDHDDDPNTPSIAFASLWDILKEDAPGLDRTDVRFGQGPNGEMFILNKRNGWVYLVSNSVPEPSTLALMFFAAVMLHRRRC